MSNRWKSHQLEVNVGLKESFNQMICFFSYLVDNDPGYEGKIFCACLGHGRYGYQIIKKDQTSSLWQPELHNVNFFTQIISVQLNLPQEKARKLREFFDI